jgi:hypothetical protein
MPPPVLEYQQCLMSDILVEYKIRPQLSKFDQPLINESQEFPLYRAVRCIWSRIFSVQFFVDATMIASNP